MNRVAAVNNDVASNILNKSKKIVMINGEIANLLNSTVDELRNMQREKEHKEEKSFFKLTSTTSTSSASEFGRQCYLIQFF